MQRLLEITGKSLNNLYLKNVLVKMGSSSPNRDENEKYLKPPARYTVQLAYKALIDPIINWASPPTGKKKNSQSVSIREGTLVSGLNK